MPSGTLGEQLPIALLEELQTERRRLTASETEYVAALYDGDIHAADRHLGIFLEELARLGLDDRTLVVVTSDHGEELGERYPRFIADHGHSLHDELLRVPLVMRDPLRSDYLPTVSAQVRLVDVMPTVADRLGVELLRPIDGSSLLPLMTGSETAHRLAVAGNTKVGPARISIRTGTFKYIEIVGVDRGALKLTPEPAARQLYDLDADPGERQNVIDARPSLAEEMKKLSKSFHASFQRSEMPTLDESADPELIERLRSLGYIR